MVVALLVAAAGLVGVEAAHLRQRRWDAVPPPPSSSLPSAAAAAGGERRLAAAAGRGDPEVSCALAEEAVCRAAAACRWRRAQGACVARRNHPLYSTSAVDDRPACRAAADGSGLNECRPGTYCKLDHEICAALDLDTGEAGVGRCVSTAVACADRADPVCGCNGMTYANKCRARKAGMSVAARGACRETTPEVDGPPPPPAEEVVPPPAATSPSSPVATCLAGADGRVQGGGECGEGRFCRLAAGACGALAASEATTGRCEAKAEICAKNMDPVCGCDGVTYPNACLARAAGMSVSFRGKCAPPPQTTTPATAAVEEPASGAEDPVVACAAGADGRSRDDACGAGRFCRLGAGTCGALAASETGAGRCAVQPDMCTEEADPVCGCDGKTYDNKCKADAAGMSVRGRGACPKPPPSDSQGPGSQGAACAAGADGRSPNDCGEGHFCRLELGQCAGLASMEVAGGRCEAKPEMCTRDMDPVCGCNGDTYPNACAARAAGMSVTRGGRCAEGDKTEAPKVDKIEAPRVEDVKEQDADDLHVDVMCMEDIYICPGGSEVSRDSANGCEFMPCPKADKMEAPQDSPVNKVNDVAGTHEDVVCMEDSRVCPDGSWVSRDSDNGCQFAPCPQVDKMEAPPLAPVMKEEDVAAPHVDVFCTSDHQVCPDGSRVRRDKENGCVFAPCPSLQQHEGPDSQGDCEVAASGLGDDAPCGAGKFCRLEAGTCGNLAPAEKGRGQCVAKAEVCTMELKPVCGCNSRTYSNACQAGADRMSVAHEGPCDTQKSDVSGIIQDPSRSPKEEFSCDPGGRCGAAGSTCAAGQETCCGETHDSVRCQCEDAGGGALAYSCFATDACNRRCPEDEQENVNQEAKKEDPLV